MAAALFRRGAGLCVRSIHRELCRVVWRPHAAVFSSKPPDRKLPRRTHIKKAKPQPAVDVAKLLEQLFSQRRPDTAHPAAAKAQPVKASSISPKTSSVKVSTSTVPRLSNTEPGVFPAASSVSGSTGSTSVTAPQSPQPKSASSTNPKTFSETPQQLPLGIIQDLTADGVSTTSASPPASTRRTSSGPEAVTEEYQTKAETATEAEELTATSAPMVENNVEAGEPLMESTTEPSVEATLPPLGTRASVEGPVTTTVDATVDATPEEVHAKSPDLGAAKISHTAGAECAVEAKADTAAQAAQTNSSDLHTTTVEPLLEITVEASVDPTIESEGDSLSHAAFIQNAHKSEVLPLQNEVESITVSVAESSSGNVAVEKEANESEQMTLESVTLASVKALVESLKTDELLQTKCILDDKADERLQELLMVQTGVRAENSTQDERGSLTEVLSKWDSLSEDLRELEGETGTLVKELLCHVPAALPKTPAPVKTSPPSNRPVGVDGDSLREEKATEGEATTLESITSMAEEKESGEREESVLEAMSLEVVTLAEVEASLGTVENGSLGETMAYLEREAEIFAGESRTEVKEVTESDDVTEDLNVESLSLAEADGLFEDVQTDALMEELLFTAPGQVAGITEAQIGQKAVRADVMDVPMGSAAIDTVASPTPTEVLLGQEMAEEGGQTEASGIEDLDPVQRLFLEKIREYNNIHRLNVGTVEAGPDYERYLAEEMAKLQRLYGGGDLSTFPQFTFTEPYMDQDCK